MGVEINKNCQPDFWNTSICGLAMYNVSLAFFGLAGSEAKVRDRTPYRYRNKTTLVKYDELFIKIKKR